jgi:uncharacterized CHY-type Zn-finger protein
MNKLLHLLILFLLLGPLLSAFPQQLQEEFPVPPPPFSEGIYPCSQCHTSMEVNRKKRILNEHTHIKLRHAETLRWCLDCHNPGNRDKLRLYSGELIGFERSYLLCGECHGNVFRDWKAGIHGKRQGYFTGGKRTYLLCVHCHDAHSPQIKPIKPEPSPFSPKDKRNVR